MDNPNAPRVVVGGWLTIRNDGTVSETQTLVADRKCADCGVSLPYDPRGIDSPGWWYGRDLVCSSCADGRDYAELQGE